MNSVIQSRLLLSAFLISLAGVGAASAAEPIGDAQGQARTLLSGRSFPSNDAKYRSIISGPPASQSVLPDAQEQARAMILGHVPAKSFTTIGPAGDRKVEVEVDALELARRMILGAQAGTKPEKARLARRAE
jgi:hypothetical protein